MYSNQLSNFSQKALNTDNSEALQTLGRAIKLPDNDFSLIFVRCNYTNLRNQMMQELRKDTFESLNIKEIVLPKYTENLYVAIKEEVRDQPPSTLMIFGLESVCDVDQVLRSTRQDREKLQKEFCFPVVLWLNDNLLSKLIRLAPDFAAPALVPIEFDLTTDELINLINSNADQIFKNILDFGAGILQETTLLNKNHDFLSFCELELAKKELEDRMITLDIKLQANLEFLLGYSPNKLLDTDLECLVSYDFDKSVDECCREQYEKSLELWQQTDNIKHQGCVLYCLGLWWMRYAISHPIERVKAFTEAKKYWQQCVSVFIQTRNEKLEQKFINAEAEGWKRVKNWEELEKVAQRAKELHQTYHDQFRLARACGFLSEVQFYRYQNWDRAKELAEKAYSLVTEELKKSPSNMPPDWLKWTQHYHQGWYLLPLAKAEKELGNVPEAIEHLKTAKKETKPEYDPELYRSILRELREIYYQKGKYADAFSVKQEQKEIEQQFGFRAFIGLSPLLEKRIVTNPVLLPSKQERRGTNAVTSSGRQKNVNDLIKRISLPQHKLIVIHGGSGVGKSSLLRARLIPALRAKNIGTCDVLPIINSEYPNWVENLGYSLKKALEQIKNIKVNKPLDSIKIIVEQLNKNAKENLLTVLIFDNFEEFCFSCKDINQIENFAKFLQDCLEIPSVKVILSLREDYLYFLLELNRLADFSEVDNNILAQNILYYLGDFSLEEAKIDIKSLTEKTYQLEDLLLKQLIDDLATPSGKIIPIELQMVGSQLENNGITTLKKYQELGEPGRQTTEILIDQFLQEITQDCGQENQDIAEVVLYLLTDHNNIRPCRTYYDLEEGLDLAELDYNVKQLNLVLKILEKSGLVTRQSSSEDKKQDTYQLAPDYLTRVIRQRFNIRYPRILGNLNRTKAQLRRDLTIGEIKQLNLTAQKLFARHDQLNALEAILKAGENLESIKKLPSDVKQETENTLKHIVYFLEEYNHFEEHNSDVYSVNFSSKSSFSPDGLLLASASWDKTIEIWDIQDNKLLKILEGHNDAVNSVKISPDGKLLASASADKTIKVWPLFWKPEEKELTIQDPKTLKGHDDWVWDVCFSLDSQILASAGGDRLIKLWQLNWSEDGEELTIEEWKTIDGHTDKVYSVDCNPDGQTLASGSEDHTIKLWNINTGICQKILQEHQEPVKSVRFSHSGDYLASASEDGTIQLWNLNDSQNKLLNPHKEQVNSVCFRSDDKVLASGGNDNTVKLWSLEGDLLKTFKGHRDWVRYVEFSPNDEILASASDDNTIKLRKLDFVLPQNLKGHTDKIHTICFGCDGKTIASAGWDGTIRLWSRETENSWKQTQCIKDLDQYDRANWVWEVSFSPNGQILASGDGNNRIKLWNLNGKLIQTLEDHTGTIHSVRFSPNGQYLASGSGDNTIKIWNKVKVENTYNWELVETCKGHKDKVWGVDFSPNNQLIASAGGDRTIKIWDLHGNCLRTFEGYDQKNSEQVHKEWINAVVFSPDGHTLASASNDCTIKLWNVSEGQCLKTLAEHNSKVYDVGFSPDGQLLVSASADKTIKIWSIDGTLLKTLEGHRDWVNSVMFSPDGKLIVSASNDQTVKVWDISNIELKSLSFEQLLERGRQWLNDKSGQSHQN